MEKLNLRKSQSGSYITDCNFNKKKFTRKQAENHAKKLMKNYAKNCNVFCITRRGDEYIMSFGVKFNGV